MYSYAISCGEGTLLEYGTIDYDQLAVIIRKARTYKKLGYVMIFGNADGTGE